MEQINLQYKDSKEVIKSGILGFFIGLAVIVPGISGSTIAILFQLYDKLLYAMGQIFKRFKLCILFLLPIIIGGISGFVLGLFAIQQLLNRLPFAIMACFGGLMIGAFPAISSEIKGEKVTSSKAFLFLLGFSIPISISIASIFIQGGNQSLEDLSFYHYILFAVLGYLVAVTQIVPGLSATALLMAFGYFRSLIESISLSYISNSPQILFVFVSLGIGFIIGMVSFSSLLTKVIEKNRKTAFFMITGLSLGSIVAMFFNPEIYETYQSWIYGNLSFGLDLSLGILLFIIGILLSTTFLKYKNKEK
ncbi:MAG: DUF368 domain-containing protein [Anaeroplasmataceae bacterium]|nr:DUF368 domain-containing protein [Anaeroplasmataceae bacterium]